MVIPYGCIDIVIKRSALENIKKGLSEELIKEYKVDKMHYDDFLILIAGGMSSYDAEECVKEIEEKYNITYLKGNVAQDMVCVESFGTCAKCPWLKWGRVNKTTIIDGKTYPKGVPYFEYTNEN